MLSNKLESRANTTVASVLIPLAADRLKTATIYCLLYFFSGKLAEHHLLPASDAKEANAYLIPAPFKDQVKIICWRG